MVRKFTKKVGHTLQVFTLITLTTFLIGCGATGPKSKPSQLAEEFWQKETPKQIVIVKTQITKKPGVFPVGAQGLLDLAINIAANKTLDQHLQRTDLSWYQDLPQKLAAEFQKRKIKATVNPMDLTPKQGKSAATASYPNSHQLLILELQQIGVERTYSGFIPRGLPAAVCVLKGELIDTQNHQVLWQNIANIKEELTMPWNQPPSYPRIATALNQAIQDAQEELIDSLFSGH